MARNVNFILDEMAKRFVEFGVEDLQGWHHVCSEETTLVALLEARFQGDRTGEKQLILEVIETTQVREERNLTPGGKLRDDGKQKTKTDRLNVGEREKNWADPRPWTWTTREVKLHLLRWVRQ